MTSVRAALARDFWRKAGLLTLGSVAAALAVAACAAQTAPGGGGEAPPSVPATGVVTSGPMSSTSPSPGDSGFNSVSPEPAVDLRRERWSRVEPVAEGAEVLVYATVTGGPPCAVLGRVEVAEAKEHVTITLWVGRRADADCDGPQPEIGYPLVTRVRLSEPVGDRQLRDGAA